MKRILYTSAFEKYRGRYGRGKCGYCGKELPKRRQYWCSDACVMKIYFECHDWKKIREEVLRRDNYICKICGKKGDMSELAVDHIIPVEIVPERQTDMANLQTLCIRCHKKKTKVDMKLIALHRKRKTRNKNLPCYAAALLLFDAYQTRLESRGDEK